MVLCAIFAFAQPLLAQQSVTQDRLALTNDSVIAMLKAKFEDATIIDMIRKHNTDFNLSVNEMIRLKQAGASQAVLQAMIEAYMHAIPDSQRRAVERVGELFGHLDGVLFSDVFKPEEDEKARPVN